MRLAKPAPNTDPAIPSDPLEAITKFNEGQDFIECLDEKRREEEYEARNG